MSQPACKPADLPLLSRPVARAGEAIPDGLLELLYEQLRRLAGPRADLDDLVQAAAERALKSLPSFAGRSAFSTWTYGVAYRTLLDHQRWYRRWRRRFVFPAEPGLPERPWTFDGEAAAIEIARARRLHQALDKLPVAKRTVIVLHELEGASLREVAEIVGANERTVRSRLHDGKRKLLALLSEDPLFDPEATP